ncbi:hypothetical protein A249_33311 [Pseudomonas syringae pv. actinidiae ICMP 18804]|uniref:Uncharacterized protein n=1 Tax=Pseudomonas syringae pv. actinidiae ICMP 19096 TaxID=1194405 RepID=A0A656K2D3_PSESF|nr:hypothetical protein A249_33311 [Pseudomonas syringae pv. actinidiae ICMP 18804]EPN66317.1 hypothetical protein A245_06489 [Pseudomonas syringae pv. actinidiae ICMP 19096]NAS95306.1 hypothetical protein [Pseudomonas syringae pv. actinidifoliorum]NAT22802.1 hypothetical protein [Pseudomonas syringae pv. actinidifoliorum]NAT36817.1 hypothetical protein [Pseudomonas syringae pv. actinidifoliorum]
MGQKKGRKDKPIKAGIFFMTLPVALCFGIPYAVYALLTLKQLLNQESVISTELNKMTGSSMNMTTPRHLFCKTSTPATRPASPDEWWQPLTAYGR